MSDKLTALKSMTIVVADTGDIDSIKQYAPQDATTNPSLVLKAAKMPQYKHLVEEAVAYGNQKGGSQQEILDNKLDKLAVNIGREILESGRGLAAEPADFLRWGCIAFASCSRRDCYGGLGECW